ncbi:hypothetical protein BN11_1480009 [Nostocoides australiense Ben110]|uniref:Uncharacterized protein n=1 Tax=Nostocoides australiense Ben110 TaxID=1193182 RepID=W6JTT2_9MICO|nr:hypothetical protein [Tetrasphaera australiensis]CCH72252.1 hypothetical protein BN11_1480009 [Tetrasphaera australiensis Ben110]
MLPYAARVSGPQCVLPSADGVTYLSPGKNGGIDVRGNATGTYIRTIGKSRIISITSPEPEVVIGHLRDQLGAVGLPIGPDDGTVFHFDGAGWSGIVTQSDATTTVNWSVAR